MRLRIATWNVNSVRLRLDHIARFAAEHAPDVLCLQEIKCQEAEFPREPLAEAGYTHVAVNGQKGWHGVAIASRLPIEPAPKLDVCREGHARCIGAIVGGIEIHNFYAPAGGDIPDREANPKFDHKLDFFQKLAGELRNRDPDRPFALVGDLNVAPGEHDVWSHRQMSRIVSHTPIEIEAMQTLRDALGLVDLPREATPEPAKLFSWWSYRAQDFRKSNRGLRLDHILVSPGLAASTRAAGPVRAVVHDDVRAWERPSDHAPVSADLFV